MATERVDSLGKRFIITGKQLVEIQGAINVLNSMGLKAPGPLWISKIKRVLSEIKEFPSRGNML